MGAVLACMPGGTKQPIRDAIFIDYLLRNATDSKDVLYLYVRDTWLVLVAILNSMKTISYRLETDVSA